MGRTRKPAAVTAAAAPAAAVKTEGGSFNGWIDLGVAASELRPEFSLNMGQCFNWKRRLLSGKEEPTLVPAAAEAAGGDEAEEEKEWVGVLGRRVLCVKQTPASTLVRQLHPDGEGDGDGDELVAELREYFQVQEPLGPLYRRWAAGDARMRQVAERIPGVRVVRQDPTECLFSFICSSNNNIPRITLMLDRLRAAYGEPLADGQYHAFPSIDALAAAPEQALRDLGLGYRAKFIRETAQKLQGLGKEAWLLGLRAKGRGEVQEALVSLPGVGRKVADCVALFSLDQTGAVPVDVHVWRIACRDYDPSLKGSKSLTPAIYERVGDLFRDRYGPHAGWAHSLLFAAELPNYRKRLPPALQTEMEAFKREESEDKAAKRAEKRERQQAQEQEEKGQEGNGDGVEKKKKGEAEAAGGAAAAAAVATGSEPLKGKEIKAGGRGSGRGEMEGARPRQRRPAAKTAKGSV